MSTEKDLAIAHPGFWRTTLPLSESFVRRMNRALERYATPMISMSLAGRRGLVNEAAFQSFAAAAVLNKEVGALEPSERELAWTRAATHVRTMRQFAQSPVDATPGEGELRESAMLAQRIADFFGSGEFERIVVQPAFLGCGWLDETRGDVLADETLFEVKAGERHFRSVDIHQLLVYCAQNFATKAVSISRIGLINPRVGVFATFDLDELCNECAGGPAADVMHEILQYVSEPLGGDAP